MTQTPRGDRLTIGIFGNRNAGKSSLINALTHQEIALVSQIAGTTTDPVSKAMELLPLGPVVFIDTAGIDDTGELGGQRVKKSLEVLHKCDIVLYVMTVEEMDHSVPDKKVFEMTQFMKIPLIGVVSKIDQKSVSPKQLQNLKKFFIDLIPVSSKTGENIEVLKESLIQHAPTDWRQPSIIGDIIKSGDTVVLVTPIDDAAPKGRLILPQVQTIRDILDHDAISLVVKERELAYAIQNFKTPPALVVTDSQAFQKVSADTPMEISLTSFSILFARYKGDLEIYLRGINKIKDLQDGDKILVAEGCTHHVQSDDIGTVKIPRWLRQHTGLDLHFEKFSGLDFPQDLSSYALAIHCGACTLNRREVLHRLHFAESAGVPITNYGMIIAYVFGILDRALKPFPHLEALYFGNIY